MNRLLTPLKLFELTYGAKNAERFNGLDIIQKEVNDVTRRWQEFVEKNFVPKPDSKERIKVLEALTCLVEDIEMLQDGRWDPDEDSCEASLDNIKLVIEYIEKQGNVGK